MKDYHVNVFYSDEDEGYIADILDLRIAQPSEPRHKSALGRGAEGKGGVDEGGESGTQAHSGPHIPPCHLPGRVEQ